MTIDYNKIFAENAHDHYQWTNNDYLKGFETVGDNPPIRQIFDALFNELDKKAQDLNNRASQLEALHNSNRQIVERDQYYNIGWIGTFSGLPSYLVIECTTAGQTGSTIPDLSNITGTKTAEEIIDGGAIFKTRYVRGIAIPMEVKLFTGGTYEDENSYIHPVLTLGDAPGLILMDWFLCDGRMATPDTINRTVVGHDGTKSYQVGGYDTVKITASNLPDEGVQINAETTETTQGQTGMQIICDTSEEDANITLKTATGDNTMTHDTATAVACVSSTSKSSDNSVVLTQTKHKHSINTQVISPSHTHAIEGTISLGSGLPLQIKNRYVNIAYFMYVG